jgi:hypothetical protein
LPKGDGFGDRHFMIKYMIEKNYYIIKDLGEGSGTFIKVQTEAILKNGHIVSFGDFHMVIGLVLDKNSKSESELSKSSARVPKRSSSKVNISINDK